VTDTALLDKNALTLVSRSVKQGPVSIDLAVKDNRVSGKMVMSGNEKAIDADAGGALFADAAGAPFVVASLPLADGYTTTFRNFDIQKQKPKLMQLKVAGTEKVTVAAGTFEAYRVEVTSADGGTDKLTLWVAKDSRKPVKMTAVMAQMGGATLVSELQ
jgi:hypothetical protein